MEIRGINQGRQSTFDFNVNPVSNTQNTQEVSGQGSPTINQSKNEQQGYQPQSGSEHRSLSEKEVKKAVDKLNKLLEDKASHVEYEVYGRFNDLTIRIVNNKTKEVIKELPPKKLIDMVDKLCELAGMFVDKKA